MKKYFAVLFILVFFCLACPVVFAADTTATSGNFNYTPLEKIPGSDTETAKAIDFYDYVSAIYKFGIWAVGIVALFMLVFGGYTYITSAGNNSSMETAKNIITDAIVGIIMALTAYLLLYVINPDLVRIKKLTPAAGVPAPSAAVAPAPGVTPPVTLPAGTYSHTEALAKLSAAGINVASSGNCSDATNSSCTSLDGIPQSTVDSLIQIKNTCNSAMTINGGTETGHLSHGVGKSVVDLGFNDSLAKCVRGNVSDFKISKICTTPQDQPLYSYNCSYNEIDRQLHVAFK
jgi:hypothetical protein